MVGIARIAAPIALPTGQALLLVATAGLCWQAWTADGPFIPNIEKPAQENTAASEAQAIRPLSGYAPLWDRDLRQPLFESTATVEPAPAAPPELPVLVGTIVEPGRRFAHLRTPDGRTLVRPVNARIESYEVMAIESGRVQLRHGSDAYWISVPRPEAAPSRDRP